MSRHCHPLVLTVGILCGCCWAAGCSTEQVDNARSLVEDFTESTAEVVESVAFDGSATIHIDKPVSFNSAYVSFTKNEGRDSVVQIKSYRKKIPSTRSFYLHAQVTAESLQELAGKTVQASLFVKINETIYWANPISKPVVVEFSNSAGNLTAEIKECTLVNTKTAAEQLATGTLECVVAGQQ